MGALFFVKVSLAPFTQQFLLSHYDIHINFSDYSFDSITTISFDKIRISKPDYFDFYAERLSITPGRKSRGFFQKQWIIHSLTVEHATLTLKKRLFTSTDEESEPFTLPDFPLDNINILFDNIEMNPVDDYTVTLHNISLKGAGKYTLLAPKIEVVGKGISNKANAACSAKFTAEFNKYDFISIDCLGDGLTMRGKVEKSGDFILKSYFDLSEVGEVFDFDIAGNITLLVEPYFHKKEPELRIQLFVERFHWDLVHLWDTAIAARVNPSGIHLENLTLYHKKHAIFTAEATMLFPLKKAVGTVQLDKFDFRDTMLRFETTGMVDWLSNGLLAFEADLTKFHITVESVGILRADKFFVSFDDKGDILALPGSQFVRANFDVTAEKLRLFNAEVTTAKTRSKIVLKNAWFTFGSTPKFYIPITSQSHIDVSDIGAITGFPMTGQGDISALVSGDMENPDVLGKLDLKQLSFAGFPVDTAQLTITLKNLLLSIMVDKATKGSAVTHHSLTTIEFSDPVKVDFNINNFSGRARDVFSLFGVEAPLSGTGAFAVHGIWQDGLKKLDGSLRVEGVSLYKNKIVDKLNVTLKTEDNRIVLHNSSLQRGHTSFSITGGMNPEDFSVDISGKMTAFSIQDLPITQKLTLIAPRASYHIRGTIPDITVDASIFAGGVSVAEIPFGNFSGNIAYQPTTQHIKFTGNLNNSISLKVEMDNFDMATLDADLHIDQFKLKLGDNSVLFSLDAEGKAGEIRASLFNITALFGPLTVNDNKPIAIHGKMRHLFIDRSSLGTSRDTIFLSGELIDFIPHLLIDGTLSPKTINAMLDGVVANASGSVDIKLTLDDQILNGTLFFNELGFTLKQLELPFRTLSGELSIKKNRWNIKHFKGKVGGGAVSLHGEGGLFPFVASELALKVQSASVNLEATGPITFSSDLMAQFGHGVEKDILTGSIILSKMDYQKDISVGSILMNSLKKTSKLEKGLDKTTTFNPRLSIDISGQNNLSVDTDLIKTHLSANVQLTGTLNRPIVRGNISLLNGIIYFQQQNFELSRGVISLEDGENIKPFIDVSGKTTAVDQGSDQENEYTLTLSVEGYPLEEDGLKISLHSAPQLEENKIFSLLLWGTTGGSEDMGQAGTLAIATVSNMIGITKQIKKNFQLTRFTIAPRYSEVDDKTVLKLIAVKEIYDHLFLELESNPTDMNDQQMGLRYKFEKSDIFLVWKNKTLLNSPYGSIGFQAQLNYLFE